MFVEGFPFLIPLVTWSIHSIISFPDKDQSLTLSLERFWDQTPPKKDEQQHIFYLRPFFYRLFSKVGGMAFELTII